MQGLIVNADDFGFSQEIIEGVCEAHVNGIVTDASLLVRSPLCFPSNSNGFADQSAFGTAY